MQNAVILAVFLLLTWCAGFLCASIGNLWAKEGHQVIPFRHATETMIASAIVGGLVLAMIYL